MDFFQRQEIARRNTKWLEVYFALAVIGTILALYAVAIAFYSYESSQDISSPDDWWNPQLFLGVSVVTLAIIGCGSLYKISALSGGGYKVAEMLGGRPVNSQTTLPNERKLINVVEEMAIASGTPVPQIYILPDKGGINAFAAGHSTGDMVICVTEGSLQTLTRDELQGVIGHEFSHILNGDMKLNLRLMGLVFGILCLTIIGKVLLRTRGRKNPLPFIGLAMIVIGGVGFFFAKLIKSAANRQREFLADASSVQFTRNPGGLANALKKVGACGSRVDEPNADDASHLFFANGMPESFFGWMSTHPPLEQRIKELDPNWDGQFITPPEAPDDADDSQTARAPATAGLPFAPGNIIGTAVGTAILAGTTAPFAGKTDVDVDPTVPGLLPHIGAPTTKHLEYAANILASLPAPLVDAAHDPTGAIGLIYALLLSPDETLRQAQLQSLSSEPVVVKEMKDLLPLVQALESRAKFPLVTLCVFALRSISPAQYAQFKQDIQSLLSTGGQTDLFAYALQKLILRRLDSNFHPVPNPRPQYYGIQQLLPDCSILLSALACAGAGQDDKEAISKAFAQGAKALQVPADSLQLDPSDYDLGKIDTALQHLNLASLPLKKLILNACAETVAADGVIEENEAELLRAISDTFDCPIPPFLTI
jgi:Zn-dependent protease with chaperone function